MKKFFLTMALMIMFVSANAQSKADEWNSFEVSYNPMTLVIDTQNGKDQDFTGFTAAFNHKISVANATPIFVEVGGAVNAAFWSDTEDGVDMNITFVSAKVPVSLMYKWNVSDAVSILPFGGLYARFNVVGKLKAEDDFDDESLNLFDKKDVQEIGWDDACKRFQIGYQIGANIMFNDTWHIGLAWASDFSELRKKCKFNTPAITIGFDF